jgi:uncharacterized membrane protein
MTELASDLLLFFRSILLRWVNLVGGAAIAFLLLWYSNFARQRGWPEVNPLWVLSVTLLCAVFLAWRDEHRKAKAREDARHTAVTKCFEQAAAILKESDHLTPFHALARANAHELASSEEVEGVRALLMAYGHGDPFEDFDEYVPREKRLPFLKFVRHSPHLNPDEGTDYLKAAEEWRARFGYPELTVVSRVAMIFKKLRSE